jgi:hypothetical protein
MSQGGGCLLPVLIELYRPNSFIWHFTSDNRDVRWGGQLYKSVPMSYKPPSSNGGILTGGTLEIDIDIQNDDGYELLAWFDKATDEAEMNVVAVVNQDGISPVGLIKHCHGTVSWNGKKITWQAELDDRLQMQINPVNFDNDALAG